jgi:hypothetical protein
MASPATLAGTSPNFIIEPLPYCLSICSIANSTAFSFSVAIVKALYHGPYNPINDTGLCTSVTLALREQRIPWATFSTTLFSISKTKIVQNFKKAPKGIDKIRIGFIIRIVGKSGEKG